MNMKTYLIDLWKFIKKPTDRKIGGKNFKKNLLYFFYTFLLGMILACVIYFPIDFLLEKIIGTTEDNHLIVDVMKRFKSSPFALMIICAVIVPFMEEVLFRKPLKRGWLNSKIFSQEKWDKIFRYLVYVSISLFGMIHLTNFQNISFWHFVLSPLVVFPQITLGILISFLRIRFNFFSGFLLHSLWNFIFFGAALLSISDIEKPYEIKSQDYEIKIEGVALKGNPNVHYFTIDSINDSISRVYIRQFSINQFLDSIFDYDRKQLDYLINLQFYSEKGRNF